MALLCWVLPMKFLVDTSAKTLGTLTSDLVAGQLLTPLTNYANAGGVFAMDNGAFSGFKRKPFFRMLERNLEHEERCLFLTVPDIVGNAKLTTELYYQFTKETKMLPWANKWAMVAQDGIEDLTINWWGVRTLFIGGTTEFKDSNACYDVVKAAKILDIPVHVGRVNTYKRYRVFADLGADTCDGSGIAKFSHMLKDIETSVNRKASPDTQADLFTEGVCGV